MIQPSRYKYYIHSNTNNFEKRQNLTLETTEFQLLPIDNNKFKIEKHKL